MTQIVIKKSVRVYFAPDDCSVIDIHLSLYSLADNNALYSIPPETLREHIHPSVVTNADKSQGAIFLVLGNITKYLEQNLVCGYELLLKDSFLQVEFTTHGMTQREQND